MKESNSLNFLTEGAREEEENIFGLLPL